MGKVKLLTKGICTGVVIFIIGRLLSRFCFLFYNTLIIKHIPYSSMQYYLNSAVNIIYICCRPLSTIFCILKGNLFQDSSVYLKHAVLIFRGLDLFFWISFSSLVLYIREDEP